MVRALYLVTLSVFPQLPLRNDLSGDLVVKAWIILLRGKTVDVLMHEWRGRMCSSICHIWKPRCSSQCKPSLTLLWPLPILSLGQCDNHLSNSMKPGWRLKVILLSQLTMKLQTFYIHLSCPHLCRWWDSHIIFILKLWIKHFVTLLLFFSASLALNCI